MQIALNLEKVYLLTQSLTNLNFSGTFSKTAIPAENNNLDKVEKRVQKEKAKALKLVKNELKQVQFEYSLIKMDQVDKIHQVCDSQDTYVDADLEFFILMRDFIIKPFGKRLN